MGGRREARGRGPATRAREKTETANRVRVRGPDSLALQVSRSSGWTIQPTRRPPAPLGGDVTDLMHPLRALSARLLLLLCCRPHRRLPSRLPTAHALCLLLLPPLSRVPTAALSNTPLINAGPADLTHPRVLPGPPSYSTFGQGVLLSERAHMPDSPRYSPSSKCRLLSNAMALITSDRRQ